MNELFLRRLPSRTVALMLIFVTLMIFTSTFPAHAKVSLKAAHVNSETHPVGIGLIYFAKRVQELTGNTVEVKVFHNATLGGERELAEAAQLGQLEIGASTMGVVASFAPELDFTSLPFLFKGYEHIEKVTTNPTLKQVLDNAMKRAGLVSLGYSTSGLRQVISRRSIKSVNDFQGLKIRTMEVPGIIAAFKALKAIPVPISYGELYSALQTGVVDASEVSFIGWISSKLYEVAKYGIQINYMDSGRSYFANPKFMDRLDPKHRKVIEQAMTESIAIMTREYKTQDEEAVKKAIKLGATVINPDLKPFIEAMKPVYVQLKPTLGIDWITKIQQMQ